MGGGQTIPFSPGREKKSLFFNFCPICCSRQKRKSLFCSTTCLFPSFFSKEQHIKYQISHQASILPVGIIVDSQLIFLYRFITCMRVFQTMFVICVEKGLLPDAINSRVLSYTPTMWPFGLLLFVLPEGVFSLITVTTRGIFILHDMPHPIWAYLVVTGNSEEHSSHVKCHLSVHHLSCPY